MKSEATVIGAGLAGSEAAFQLAERGHKVHLYEMRPVKNTPVHTSGDFAELVCSNSLRASARTNAPGLLKEELRRLSSLLMEAADANAIAAGGALAVDRVGFQRHITERLLKHPNITVHREECTSIPEEKMVVVATGPLTSDAMAKHIQKLSGEGALYFYDAAAPIVTLESIDMNHAFCQSRYDKGDGNDYLNCPLSKEEYHAFYHALIQAEWIDTKAHEKAIFFEGCMPLEAMAERGFDTLRFGPLKPVGLKDPHTGKEPYAVVQLRFDDAKKQLLNLVGCQTRMKWGDQKKVFALIPALREAEFVRWGVMHRNTFMNGPKLLAATGQFKSRKNLFFAGQMTGVEGYIESAASGLVAGCNAARMLLDAEPLIWPQTTAIGALMHHISSANPDTFQPMNINFGLLEPLTEKFRKKKERTEAYANRALSDLANFMEQNHV